VRLVDGDKGERNRVFEVGQGLADEDVLDACDCCKVALAGGTNWHTFEVFSQEELGDLGAANCSVDLAPGN